MIPGLTNYAKDTPKNLIEMIYTLKYKKSWSFSVLPDNNHLVISVETENSINNCRRFSPDYYQEDYVAVDCAYKPLRFREIPFVIKHTIQLPHPDLQQDLEFSRRWLIDQIIRVETHEACEFFSLPSPIDTFGAYYKPFFPNHEDNSEVYRIIDRTPKES